MITAIVVIVGVCFVDWRLNKMVKRLDQLIQIGVCISDQLGGSE